MTTIVVEMYSEKAIVVRNTLEHHGSALSALGGTFNERLKGGRGWIFPKHMLTQVRNIAEKLNSGQYGNEYEQKSSHSSEEYVSKTEYLSLLSRVERLEALVANRPVSALVKPSGFVQNKLAFKEIVSVSEHEPVEDMDMDIEHEPVEKKRLVPMKK
jgi:hypothetical protein